MTRRNVHIKYDCFIWTWLLDVITIACILAFGPNVHLQYLAQPATTALHMNVQVCLSPYLDNNAFICLQIKQMM